MAFIVKKQGALNTDPDIFFAFNAEGYLRFDDFYSPVQIPREQRTRILLSDYTEIYDLEIKGFIKFYDKIGINKRKITWLNEYRFLRLTTGRISEFYNYMQLIRTGSDSYSLALKVILGIP